MSRLITERKSRIPSMLQIIRMKNEAADRLYYSGFCGPLNREGESHLYVSLRCMQLLADGYRLYAGGGLLPESQMQQEWNETEAKMEAMRQLIR